ncbi:MAG: alpha/beta hydrolase [Clostridia bacterium]|nr:alpha/beta hydrolase [Clostridia bacterium]
MTQKYKLESQELTDEVRKSASGLFISLPCGNTHYSIEGEGDEWVVLVHGYATPYFIYDKIAEGLISSGYKILRYDLLGRGLSERVPGPYTPALFARQLDELTTALLGETPFYLFGTSMGGTITTTYTAAHPDKVKKLVLLAPAGMHFKVPFYMKLARPKGIGEVMFRSFGGKALQKNCAKEMLYSGEEVKKSYEEKFAYHMQYKGMLDATLSSLRNTILNFDEARIGYDGVAAAKTPVLVIWGTADKTMPYYQNEEMKKVLPQMTLITYENSGHIFLYDEGERTLRDVLPFLKGER